METKRITIIVRTEISTMMEIDIPIGPKQDVGLQVDGYINEHENDIANQAKENLFKNMESDWKENLEIEMID